MMKNKEAMAKALRSLKRKFMVAVSMLLVSVMMMTSVTYAWLVLSTKPEVSGVTTQVGANGSLEIALLSTESYNDLSLLDSGDYNESVPTSTASNLIWGNLIDLSDPSYGLSKIILQPARLNIKEHVRDENGKMTYQLLPSLLKVPVMGENGQIVDIKKDAAVSSVCTYKEGVATFPVSGTPTYGFRAIGTAANQSIYQLALNTVRNELGAATSAARTTASNILQTTGGALGNIVVKYALGGDTTYKKDDIQAMKDLAVGLDEALQQIETALRQVYAGYIVSDKYESKPAGWNYEAALAEITGEHALSLEDLHTKYPATGVVNMENYIGIYSSNKTKVTNAIAQCDTMLASGDSFTWDQIVTTMNPLVDYTKMTLNGRTITELKGMSMSELVSVVGTGGITITVPSGSGIISDVADFAGNYVAKVTVENVPLGGSGVDVTVKMTTETKQDPVYLVACSRVVGAMKAAAAEASSEITDFYGYAIDLAFRTNASDSNLLLQTESANRVGDAYVDNPNLQGGGSYMQFGTENGISVTKMVKLMNAVRVVFIDTDKNVLCIAALDAYLGQDAYRILTDQAEKDEHPGMHAVLNSEFTGITAQNSDYITLTEYNSLESNSTVEFDKTTNSVKAKLYLYDFHMTVSDVPDSNGNFGLTGGITLDGKLGSSAITSLVENQVKVITAITFFDGSYVNNTMVSAESSYSLRGVLNLQFASDVSLLPAYNENLANGGNNN